MTFFRKIPCAHTAVDTFFEQGKSLMLDAAELDFYLFNREARMDEAWGPERRRIGSEKLR
jgi:hypothetical protein